ncbi:MAG: hypothetical protein DYH12_30435 [Sorangiineae bacterium PRO1]|nr:hypothetical protein [Sorangiineae bacterium PRO1]MCK6534250.1 hypothetical protein [Polyangiaceae bacterium]
MTEEEILHALRGRVTDADREQFALGVVYEAARALEQLAELRQRLQATAAEIDGELPLVEHPLARTMSALAQLRNAIEELEAVAEHTADTLAP